MSAKRGIASGELEGETPRRRASSRGNLTLTTAAMWILATAAAAMTEVRIHLLHPDADNTEVTLVDPESVPLSLRDDDGDGWIVVEPEGPAGNYRVTINASPHSTTRTVTVLEGGAVTVVYKAANDVEIVYSGQLRSEEEIVVTARRREENLQSVPLSIAAFTGDALAARSVDSLRDVGDFAANVDFSVTNGLSGATSEATVYIRGIGQIDTALFADPGVGIYVDGVYLARAGGSVLDLLDLERVEVLRGPQGTLFGKNTTGGAISLVTRKPGPEKALSLGLTIGSLDRLDARLTSNFQATDDLFVSLLGASTNREGFSESVITGERFADDNRDSVRGALRWLASDNLILDVASEFMREREKAANQTLVSIESAPLLDFYNTALAAAGFASVTDAFVAGDLLRSFATADSRSLGDVMGTTATLTWTSGAIDVTSITAYREIEYDVSSDGDGTPVPLAEREFLQTQNQLSQELHVGGSGVEDRLRWLVGGLYFRESSDEDSLFLGLGNLFEALEAAPGPIYAPPGTPDFLCSPGPPPPELPCFGGVGNPANFAFFFGLGDFERIELETLSVALFGETTYALNDRFSASLGLRYTLEEKEFDFFRDPGSGAPNVVLSNEDDWDSLSPRFSLAYQASNNALVYVSAARGFKSGGFNGRPQDRLALDPFDPEIVWAYEVGWKTDLADDRLRLNGAAFYNNYTDIQFSASLNVDGMPVFVIQNAGEAKVKGFELELTARPRRGVDLTAALGYIDGEYTDLENVDPNAVTLNGVLPKTPEWTFNLSPQVALPLRSGGTLTLRADYNYRSDFFNDVSNSPQIAQDAYGLLSARVAWTSQSTDWELALFGTNLGDEEYLEHGFNAAAFGATVGVAGRPREWGFAVQRHF